MTLPPSRSGTGSSGRIGICPYTDYRWLVIRCRSGDEPGYDDEIIDIVDRLLNDSRPSTRRCVVISIWQTQEAPPLLSPILDIGDVAFFGQFQALSAKPGSGTILSYSVRVMSIRDPIEINSINNNIRELFELEVRPRLSFVSEFPHIHCARLKRRSVQKR